MKVWVTSHGLKGLVAACPTSSRDESAVPLTCFLFSFCLAVVVDFDLDLDLVSGWALFLPDPMLRGGLRS